MARLQIKRTDGNHGRFLSALLTCLPGAWINPSTNEWVSLYGLRYRMALDEKKFDTALIFLNKILEVDPLNLEAKLCKGDLYRLHLRDYTRAVEQYNKVLKLTAEKQSDSIHLRARNSLSELMELLS